MKAHRVLVVDDEPLARERMTRLLREAGCTVVGELCNGVELLAWLAAPPPIDAIFLDIQMPGPNGMEVLAECAQAPPVVFVTAFSEYAVRAFELAAVDYLLKPVFPDRLLACLKRLEARLVRPLSAEELRALLPRALRFPVRAGEGEIFMELEMVTHFMVESGHVWAYRGFQKYLTRWLSLAETEAAFPEAGLLRIQRNLLLRPEVVKGHRPASPGRIKVLIAPGLELEVSRAMTFSTRQAIKDLVL